MLIPYRALPKKSINAGNAGLSSKPSNILKLFHKLGSDFSNIFESVRAHQSTVEVQYVIGMS